MTTKVWVATYQHRHGEDTQVFATSAAASVWKNDIADTWWEKELPSTPRPENEDTLGDVYFEMLEDRDEYFNVGEYEVIGA
jgi:hypothetical protein